MIIVRILKWGDEPCLGSKYNHERASERGKKVRDARWHDSRVELVWSGTSQGMLGASGSWEWKRMDFPPPHPAPHHGISKRKQACQHLDFTQTLTVWTYDFQDCKEINLFCSNLLQGQCKINVFLIHNHIYKNLKLLTISWNYSLLA